jgi:hypothetical protein
MTTRIVTPQSHVRLGFARGDITPPVGSYHRMWGAALHDRSTGVHRPLLATALHLESLDGNGQQLILGLDHCLLDPFDFQQIRQRVGTALGIASNHVHVSMSHTHGSGWMSRSREHLPGGDTIGRYLDSLYEISVQVARDAKRVAEEGTILYGFSRCSLATHRDYRDRVRNQVVCGFNPDGPADDTVLVGKAVSVSGKILGSVVNYACHPTTLAWQNTLISPDYIGAMRELIENATGATCLFLQGASGDLGPREGFVGDVAVADRNGRQLGYAALSGLEPLPQPGTQFEYAGPVVSGAVLGTWEYRPADAEILNRSRCWQRHEFVVPLPYRPDLPTEDVTREELARWEREEALAREQNQPERISDCRAKAEQMTRQLARLAALPEGKVYPFPVSILRIGDGLWVFTPGELYQQFQVELRRRFPNFAVVVSTVTNDWQPGYIPPATAYGYDIYQEIIAATAAGSSEALTQAVCREVEKLVDGQRR